MLDSALPVYAIVPVMRAAAAGQVIEVAWMHWSIDGAPSATVISEGLYVLESGIGAYLMGVGRHRRRRGSGDPNEFYEGVIYPWVSEKAGPRPTRSGRPARPKTCHPIDSSWLAAPLGAAA